MPTPGARQLPCQNHTPNPQAWFDAHDVWMSGLTIPGTQRGVNPIAKKKRGNAPKLQNIDASIGLGAQSNRRVDIMMRAAHGDSRLSQSRRG